MGPTLARRTTRKSRVPSRASGPQRERSPHLLSDAGCVVQYHPRFCFGQKLLAPAVDGVNRVEQQLAPLREIQAMTVLGPWGADARVFFVCFNHGGQQRVPLRN